MSEACKITTLWVVVMGNMIFADILSFMTPGFLTQVMGGTAEGVVITPMLLLVAAIFIEIAIMMIYLTRALPQRISRVANMVAAGITIVFVVGGGSLAPHYLFLATFEVGALLYISYLAWTWRVA